MNVHSFIFATYMRVRDENKELTIRRKALEMLVKDGFDGFSMQKLAKAAEVSPGTLYIYFKDKEDLVLKVCVEVGQQMTKATMKGFDPEMSFREGLKIQWMNRARYCLKNPVEMHFMEQVKYSPLYQKYMHMAGNEFKEKLSAFVHNAIKRNELIKLPIEVYWSLAFAPLYTLVKFHMTGSSVGGHPFRFSEKTMLETLELVLKALKP